MSRMKSATKTVASTFGVIVGLAGLEHGTGEILQGNVPPTGIFFESWPDSAFLQVLAGEPAMSLIPNLLVSGILTVLFSLVMILWSVKYLTGKWGGLVLILLSILLLLVGGGLAPPLMGLMVGLTATRIQNPLRWWSAQSPSDSPPLLGRLWRSALVASVIGYLALLPGAPIADRLFGIDENLIYFLGLFSFGTLILAILAALAWDSHASSLILLRNPIPDQGRKLPGAFV